MMDGPGGEGGATGRWTAGQDRLVLCRMYLFPSFPMILVLSTCPLWLHEWVKYSFSRESNNGWRVCESTEDLLLAPDKRPYVCSHCWARV